MSNHDPRIITLAKDPRTAPVLVSIVESGGAHWQASRVEELAAFECMIFDSAPEPIRDARGLVTSAVAGMLAYIHSVADALAGRRRVEHDLPMVLAALRGEPCERWPAVRVCDVLDAAQDEGLLVGEELDLTPLGRAVLLVLEKRSAS